jgi:hypothetical protein
MVIMKLHLFSPHNELAGVACCLMVMKLLMEPDRQVMNLNLVLVTNVQVASMS